MSTATAATPSRWFPWFKWILCFFAIELNIFAFEAPDGGADTATPAEVATGTDHL